MSMRFLALGLGLAPRQRETNCSNLLVDQERHCRDTADSRIPTSVSILSFSLSFANASHSRASGKPRCCRRNLLTCAQHHGDFVTRCYTKMSGRFTNAPGITSAFLLLRRHFGRDIMLARNRLLSGHSLEEVATTLVHTGSSRFINVNQVISFGTLQFASDPLWSTAMWHWRASEVPSLQKSKPAGNLWDRLSQNMSNISPTFSNKKQIFAISWERNPWTRLHVKLQETGLQSVQLLSWLNRSS